MASSTNVTTAAGLASISGLASGIDWQTMITQLMAVEHKPVDLVTAQETATQGKLTEWQTVNSKLQALQSAADSLKDPANFQLFTSTMSTNSSTVQASDLLSVSTSTTATPGTYSLNITNLAQAQKLSSNPFTSQTTALGSNYAGDIVINGKVLTINATDTLAGVANSINNLNTGSNPSGVTASVINFGANDYRMVLTSDQTGAKGISLLNGSSANLVQTFGWKDNKTYTINNIKNPITLGAQSDRFSSANVAVGSLLGLSTGESGDVTIGASVHLDLSTMSLTDIKNAINSVAPTGVSASVISQTVDNTTYYRLQIDGAQPNSDTNNILNTLGVLDHGSADVMGKVSGNSMTSQGTSITSATLLKDIDGYNTFTPGGYPAGDYITLTGTDTSGTPLATDNFSITSSTTVQDLLDEIKAQYGNVLAYVTNDGKIRVDDLSGGGNLTVNLAGHIADTNSQLDFVTGSGNFGDTTARQRQIVAGEDAAITLDGVAITNASNTIKNVINGVTLNLTKEDPATVSLNVGRDVNAIKKNIQDYVGKYNDMMSYINTQFSYDTKAQQAGGVLFGDGTLSSIKSDISTLTTQPIWGVNSNFSIMGMMGINLDKNQQLTVDDATLTGYLQTNFNDVISLFTAQGSTSSTNLAYVGYTKDSKAGQYAVHINRAATQGAETGSITPVGAADTLTVTQGGNTANITITAGMTLDDIVNAINTEFNTVHTQTLSGSQQLKQGDNTTPITSATTWNNIYYTTQPLQNGDTINFSGTSRGGTAIAGSYTIGNVATDNVQGLLSAIENAFSNQVSASIDTSGRITVTDKYTGSSQLAVDITEPASRDLDFGTVLTTNSGGATGRYALSMTAANDGSNHLTIKNNYYGSTSFTISQDSSDNNYDQMIYTTVGNTTSSTNGAASITSGTTWNDVYGANVANGDTITIGGMARDGLTPISATYTVTDKTTDTINGLLTAIESAYSAQGTTVDATIRDGKIYVEDLATGASSISLTLTAHNQGAGHLALGTFDQNTKRDMDLGLVNGTYSGQDVAGTINGETAAGSGQVLTGAAGNASTAGLSVQYTGSSNGTDAGTVKLTLGLGALLSNALYNITDPISGYLMFKETSLQDNINSYQTQISEMEARLALKQTAMTNQFTAMEMAISKIQSQGSWLTGQITSATSGWKL